MSTNVSSYALPAAIRSPLFRSPPDAVPPTDELEGLHAELRALKQRTLERARKAGDDLRTIEESMRRLKEKEKGKAKAVEKIKRERGFTPLPNGDDARSSTQPLQTQHKARPPSVSVVSAPSAATPPLDARARLLAEEKRKKKKRKREDVSDAETEAPQKSRKASPLPQHTHPHQLPPKVTKYPSSTSYLNNKPNTGPDFALPQPTQLLPPRPPVPVPPTPGPSKPHEVMEDFSKTKASGQTAINTFYTSIEPWLRPLKDEDIGYLEYTGDEVEPFVLPKLGKHYSEVWEEEDIHLYGGPLPSTTAIRGGGHLPGSSSSAPLPRWEPSTLMEADLLAEERGHGPLTERLVSALIPMQNATEWKGVKAAEEAMEGRPGTNGAAAAAARDKLNVADLEERIKNVMRFHGLLEEVPDFSEAVDDPIATALRHAQHELRTVLATNKLRKERLAAIARDRLAYQEYVDLRDSIDRNITVLYEKLQKKSIPKQSKKKKKSVDMNGSANGVPANISALPPCPASLGLEPDPDLRLSVPEQLSTLVQTRRQWVDVLGKVFDAKEEESPGRIYGIPRESVFQGIDEEVKQLLERPPPPANPAPASPQHSTAPAYAPSGKGKARAAGSAMQPG